MSKKSKWYEKKSTIILFLIFFFPVGLFLMWKYADWTKKHKWLVTGVGTLFITAFLSASQFLTPVIVINDIDNNKINTDNATYELTGRVSSAKDATLQIDSVDVPLTVDSTFSYPVDLEEGDNVFTLSAFNDNGVSTEEITVHRTTQAEFEARAEAERIKEKTESEEAQARDEQEQDDLASDRDELISNNIVSMRETSKEAILRVLKAPSTAKFPGDGFIDDPLQDWEYGWADDYEDLIYMSSYVDSENSFGAALRSQFQTGLRIEGDAYNLVYVFFDGSVLYDER